jgi:hypothetical protein
MRNLARLQAVIIDLDGTRYRLRPDCQGQPAKAFQAAGVAIRRRSPRAAQLLAPEPPAADSAALPV